MAASPKVLYEFGPFRVDPEKQSLLRGDEPVPITPKTFETLLILIRHSREVVSKDELMKELWPDSFVEESNLSQNIFVLRKALGDTPEDRRYIATLPGKGYRFVAKVRSVAQDGEDVVIASRARSQMVVEPSDSSPSVELTERTDTFLGYDKPSRPRENWAWLAQRPAWMTGGAVVIAIAVVLVFWWNQSRAVPVVEAVTQLTDDGEPKPTSKVVTDGLRVYFNEGTLGSLKIAQVAVTGGSVAVIPTVANPRIVGLAPEGSALLAITGPSRSANPLWEIPLPAGEPRRIGSVEAHDASFFPDGRILFAREGDLYLTEKDGSNPRKLVSVEGLIRQPSISPDGQRIIFTVWAGSPYASMSIVEASADGSGLRQIVNSSESGLVCCPEWSPDGRYIVFQNRHAGRRDLWLLPMKTRFFQRVHQPIQLTNGPLSYTFPASSHDGKQIFTLGLKERGELVRFDATANEFLPFLSGISAFNPTFSRDGSWVAYISYPDHALWRSRPDGSERLQLTYPPMQVYYPFISPDGKRVVYGNVKGETYVVSMDGGPPQRIMEKDTAYANWSPDGNLLVFTNAHDPAHPKLQLLDLRTGKRSDVPGSQHLCCGQWLSEDTLVAVPDDFTKLVIFDSRTQKWSDLVPGKLPTSVVNWAHSPDFKYLYYTTGGAEPQALRIRLTDQKVETIASLKDLRRARGPDGNTQISVAPDGSPIFTRDIGTQEIYALSVKWR